MLNDSKYSVYRGTSIDQAWLAALRHLPKCAIAPRGLQLAREAIGAQVIVDDARRCVLTNPKRRLGYKFMLAELFWILAGCDKLEPIQPFSKEIGTFSDDGQRFFGAYGPKIMTQLPYVIGALRNDLYTRQAVINIWRESPPPSRDIPCTTSCQFIYRGNKLHIVVFMRSSDVWLGLPYDCFNFCNLLQLVADQVGVEAGSYVINMGSLHLYSKDRQAADTVLSFSRRWSLKLLEWNGVPYMQEWLGTLWPKGNDLTSHELTGFVNQVIHETHIGELINDTALHRS